MSFIGKIFILLIFVMSLVFMSFAVAVYSTHQNWRMYVERPASEVGTNKPLGLRFQLQEAEKRRQDLEDEHRKLEAEVAAERIKTQQTLAKLASENDKMTKERVALDQKLATLEQSEQKAIAAMQTAQDNLTRLTGEVGGLRKEIRDAQNERDKHFAQMVALTDQIHQVRGELRRATEREVQLARRVADQKKVLAANSLDEHTPVDHVPPPLRGKVLAVNRSNLVELSLGSDDGLRVGHTLDVYRGNNYLGRIEVTTLTTDKAVGRILPDYRRGTIQSGDYVATRLAKVSS